MKRTFHFATTQHAVMLDPYFDGTSDRALIKHWTLLLPVAALPRDIPNDPNARSTNTNKPVYKKVKDTLLEDKGLFQLMNKGITLIAHAVMVRSDGTVDVEMEDHDGIVDGGHTYNVISEALRSGARPTNQCVTITVRVGVPPELYPSISRGLNTSLQVKDTSLANLAGQFEWLKTAVAKTPFGRDVAWQENDPGSIKALDLVKVLACFNTKRYPDGKKHPVEAYSSMGKVFREYQANSADYEWLAPIVSEIFELYDHITYTTFTLPFRQRITMTNCCLAEPVRKGYPPLRYSGAITLPKPVTAQLHLGVILPMLAAFRLFVAEDPETQMATWTRSFAEVKGWWDRNRVEFLDCVYTRCVELGNNPQSLGKDRMTWNTLYSDLKMALLESSIPLSLRPPAKVVQRNLLLSDPSGLLTSEEDLEEFLGEQRINLEERRERVLRDLASLGGRALRAEEKAQQIAQQKYLAVLDAALGRLEEDLYGLCKECEALIGVERLNELPYATTCTGCTPAGVR